MARREPWRLALWLVSREAGWAELDQLLVLSRVEHAVLHTRRNDPVGLGVRHPVGAGLEPFRVVRMAGSSASMPRSMRSHARRTSLASMNR